MKHGFKSGFTLIELLVVISIMGLMSSVVISTVAVARTKAKIQRANTELLTLIKIISFAQGESGKTLMKMSIDGGSGMSQCSRCVGACASPNDLRNVPISNYCYDEWTKIMAGVKMNAGNYGDNLTKLTRDPWGSPYLVDQNQGEGGANCSGKDVIFSAGPDGVIFTSDDISFSQETTLSPTCP